MAPIHRIYKRQNSSKFYNNFIFNLGCLLEIVNQKR